MTDDNSTPTADGRPTVAEAPVSEDRATDLDAKREPPLTKPAPKDSDQAGTRDAGDVPAKPAPKDEASDRTQPAPKDGAAGKPKPAAKAGTPGKRRRWLRALAALAEIGIILLGVGALALWCSIPSTKSLADHNPTTTAFIDLRRAQAVGEGRTFDLKWKWRPIGKISRYLRAAIIYAEDYNFYRHDGVDWDALEEALEANLDSGSLSIGGSTITQQLAKNLYLSPSRSMVRKLREMLIAFSLEDSLSKQRILELYLNVVEWGDGVFGAEAAARHWFGHSAQTLGPAEAVRLAIALPNPITRAPNIRSAELTRKAVRIVHLLRMQGLLDETQERAALDQVGARNEPTIPTRKRPEPGQPVTQPGAVTPDAAREPSNPEPTPEPTPEPVQPATPEPVTTPEL